MATPTKIDATAFCVSPCAAPAVLALLGLAFGWTSATAGYFSILFWQVLLAIEYAPLYFAASMPISWLLWRLLPSLCTSQRPIFALLLVAATVFAISANVRALGVLAIGPLEPETFSFIVGVVLNAITFIWISRRELRLRSKKPT